MLKLTPKDSPMDTKILPNEEEKFKLHLTMTEALTNLHRLAKGINKVSSSLSFCINSANPYCALLC